MQNVSGRNIPPRRASGGGEASPLLKLARRIREEQGPEQVKAFLEAMRPFAAPYELKNIGDGFGISFDPSPYSPPVRKLEQPQPPKAQNPGNGQLEMLKMIMQLKGSMQNGAVDPMKLLGLFGGNH